MRAAFILSILLATSVLAVCIPVLTGESQPKNTENPDKKRVRVAIDSQAGGPLKKTKENPPKLQRDTAQVFFPATRRSKKSEPEPESEPKHRIVTFIPKIKSPITGSETETTFSRNYKVRRLATAIDSAIGANEGESVDSIVYYFKGPLEESGDWEMDYFVVTEDLKEGGKLKRKTWFGWMAHGTKFRGKKHGSSKLAIYAAVSVDDPATQKTFKAVVEPPASDPDDKNVEKERKAWDDLMKLFNKNFMGNSPEKPGRPSSSSSSHVHENFISSTSPSHPPPPGMNVVDDHERAPSPAESCSSCSSWWNELEPLPNSHWSI
ncbi:hypothetical protein BDP27DRAFT_1324925 [Rhodocollybia butyracea]|uniref:Secreted protein n=1 Tax=Rhodocollybia butyracea TaxID=206335 RepID=A0A9P5PTJ2_9AGAR|nr:hypothetical protein BDP27DRAFT_1324925 [Rhodocollybia butyracea]